MLVGRVGQTEPYAGQLWPTGQTLAALFQTYCLLIFMVDVCLLPVVELCCCD